MTLIDNSHVSQGSPIHHHPSSSASSSTTLINDGQMREQLKRTKRKENQLAKNLSNALNYLHDHLVMLDGQRFFREPVDTKIAPNYYVVIKNPMDFSTMKKQIESKHYSTIKQYEDDFRLMCDNCLMFNGPHTIYYQEAQKLLNRGLAYFQEKRLLSCYNRLIAFASLTGEQLGFPVDESMLLQRARQKQLRHNLNTNNNNNNNINNNNNNNHHQLGSDDDDSLIDLQTDNSYNNNSYLAYEKKKEIVMIKSISEAKNKAAENLHNFVHSSIDGQTLPIGFIGTDQKFQVHNLVRTHRKRKSSHHLDIEDKLDMRIINWKMERRKLREENVANEYLMRKPINLVDFDNNISSPNPFGWYAKRSIDHFRNVPQHQQMERMNQEKLLFVVNGPFNNGYWKKEEKKEKERENVKKSSNFANRQSFNYANCKLSYELRHLMNYYHLNEPLRSYFIEMFGSVHMYVYLRSLIRMIFTRKNFGFLDDYYHIHARQFTNNYSTMRTEHRKIKEILPFLQKNNVPKTIKSESDITLERDDQSIIDDELMDKIDDRVMIFLIQRLKDIFPNFTLERMFGEQSIFLQNFDIHPKFLRKSNHRTSQIKSAGMSMSSPIITKSRIKEEN